MASAAVPQQTYRLKDGRDSKAVHETLRIRAERDAVFERDRKDAEPWRDVKAELLRNFNTPLPRESGPYKPARSAMWPMHRRGLKRNVRVAT